MLVRFGAIAVVAGLGAGLLLRLIIGRSRFGLMVVAAHVPLAAHVVAAALGGMRDGAPAGTVLTFAAASAAVVIASVLLGTWAVRRSPFLAALSPGIGGLLYTVLPFLLYERAVSLTAASGRLALTSYGIYFLLLALLFFVPLLLPFAPSTQPARR